MDMNKWLDANFIMKAMPKGTEKPNEIGDLTSAKIDPRDYYNELYKQWGGLEGLKKMRDYDQTIRLSDFSSPVLDKYKKSVVKEYGEDTLHKVFPDYNPMDLINRPVNLHYQIPNTGDRGFYVNDNISLNPYYEHKWNMGEGRFDLEPAAYDTLRHELAHTYQPLTQLVGSQPEKQKLKDAYFDFKYNARPNEMIARMSAIMGNFVQDKNTPVYNDQTSQQFLDYMKDVFPKEYKYLNDDLDMEDSTIKNLSKKIVSNNVTNGRQYG